VGLDVWGEGFWGQGIWEAGVSNEYVIRCWVLALAGTGVRVGVWGVGCRVRGFGCGVWSLEVCGSVVSATALLPSQL
jgi:hypothetical protein